MGQGKSMQEAMDEVNMVVEGVYSCLLYTSPGAFRINVNTFIPGTDIQFNDDTGSVERQYHEKDE